MGQYVAWIKYRDDVGVDEVEQELCEIIADLAVNEDPMGMYLERYPVSWFTLVLQFSNGRRICFKTSFWYDNNNGAPVVDSVNVKVERGNWLTYSEDIERYSQYFRDVTLVKLVRMANNIIASGSIKNW